MGDSSRKYSCYYFVLFAVFTWIGVVGIGLYATVAGLCTATCPLIRTLQNITDRSQVSQCGEAQCLYQIPITNTSIIEPTCESAFDVLTVFPDSLKIQRQCFFCNATDGFEIYYFKKRDGSEDNIWFPAPKCDVPASVEWSWGWGVNSNNEPCYSVPAEFNFRPFVRVGLLVLTGLYIMLAIMCLVLGILLRTFRNKNANDWLDLTHWEKIMGCVVKRIPLLITIANLGVLLLLISASIMIWGLEVCKHEVDSIGRRLFFQGSSLFIGTSIIVWFVTGIAGSMFRQSTFVDSSFANPRKHIETKKGNKILKKYLEPVVEMVKRFGP